MLGKKDNEKEDSLDFSKIIGNVADEKLQSQKSDIKQVSLDLETDNSRHKSRTELVEFISEITKFVSGNAPPAGEIFHAYKVLDGLLKYMYYRGHNSSEIGSKEDFQEISNSIHSLVKHGTILHTEFSKNNVIN